MSFPAVILGVILTGVMLFFFWGGVVGFIAWFTAFTTLWTIFAFGTFWFWALVFVAAAAIIISIDEADPYLYEHDTDGGSLALFAVIVSAVLLQFFGDIKLFSYVYSHPWYSLGWLGAYIGLGVVYATGRWIWLLFDRKSILNENKDDFFTAYEIAENTIPDEYAGKWEELVKRYGKKPRPKDHKGRIIRWLAFWPWSMVWFFVSDFIKKFFRRIYDLVEGFFEFCSDKIWRGVEKELNEIKVSENPSRGGGTYPERTQRVNRTSGGPTKGNPPSGPLST